VDLGGLKGAFNLLDNAELELEVGVDGQRVDQTVLIERNE